MNQANEVQAMEKISSEVNESQITIIFSSQCIKAQAVLVNKLKKQAEHHREVYNYINSANLKLETEIKQAEQEIRSMLIAQDTIKTANVELKKEWLLAKEKKESIIDQVENGVKKYEAVWSECKQRYERIPFVQKLLQTLEKVQTLNNDIGGLEKEVLVIYEEIKTRRNTCVSLDKQRVVELAMFMVNELPNMKKDIQEKSNAINNLSKQLQILKQEQVNCCKDLAVDEQNTNDLKKIKLTNDDLSQLCKNVDVSLIPKLELADFDLDAIDVNLDQVKIKKMEVLEETTITAQSIINSSESNTNFNKDKRVDEFIISPYFRMPIINEDSSSNYSKRKLINILEDIKLDKKEAYNIVSKVNPDKFQVVNEIHAELEGQKEKNENAEFSENDIEVIDLTSSNKESILIPPTQFLDITIQGSQENLSKKRVTFDLRSTTPANEIHEDTDKLDEQNQSIISRLDAGSDDSFMKIKDMILKKHNLDLSPKFVYGKNNILQKNDDDKVISSKFFQHDKISTVHDNVENNIDVNAQSDIEPDETVASENNLVQQNTDNVLMVVDEPTVPASEENKGNKQNVEKSISGLLFTHGPQGITDSLDISISTTGYEDSDFPHCIDSSLLLSPKADVPMTEDKAEILSQDVPNFLSGFRKIGLSFFGSGPSANPNPDNSAQNQENNFSFNFRGDVKKNRGGLFNMFQ